MCWGLKEEEALPSGKATGGLPDRTAGEGWRSDSVTPSVSLLPSDLGLVLISHPQLY